MIMDGRMHLYLVMSGGTRLVMWLTFLLAAGIQGYVETEEFISDLDKPGKKKKRKLKRKRKLL